MKKKIPLAEAVGMTLTHDITDFQTALLEKVDPDVAVANPYRCGGNDCNKGGNMAGMAEKIFRLNHDCFRIEGGVTIYTDPFHLSGKLPKADLILISHEHFDHCSPEDIQKIAKADTTMVAPADCKDKLKGNVIIVKAGDSLEVKGVKIEVVPAYNTSKNFHPPKAGHVGYIFTVGAERIYFAGDTDRIPEMKTFRVDIALLPVSGTYVMTAEEAVEAARDIRPKLVIPMHYGDIVGTEEDAKRFMQLYKGNCAIK